MKRETKLSPVEIIRNMNEWINNHNEDFNLRVRNAVDFVKLYEWMLEDDLRPTHLDWEGIDNFMTNMDLGNSDKTILYKELNALVGYELYKVKKHVIEGELLLCCHKVKWTCDITNFEEYEKELSELPEDLINDIKDYIIDDVSCGDSLKRYIRNDDYEFTIQWEIVPNEEKTMKRLYDTDIIILTSPTDALRLVSSGEIIIYGDMDEAKSDVRSNETIITCDKLPKGKLRDELIRQINKN